jgi:hypothetical protein
VYEVAKAKDFVMNVLPFYDDTHFARHLRMFRSSFNALVDLIKDDEVFQSRGNKLQAPVAHQLMVFLQQIGSTSDVFSICSQQGIAEGTVVSYMNRVMKALCRRASQFVQWPRGDRRHEVCDGF